MERSPTPFGPTTVHPLLPSSQIFLKRHRNQLCHLLRERPIEIGLIPIARRLSSLLRFFLPPLPAFGAASASEPRFFVPRRRVGNACCVGICLHGVILVATLRRGRVLVDLEKRGGGNPENLHRRSSIMNRRNWIQRHCEP